MCSPPSSHSPRERRLAGGINPTARSRHDPRGRAAGDSAAAGSGPAEHAAYVFIGAYLAWLYRRAPLQAVTAATSALLGGFKAHQPRVPPTMQPRHPKVVAIAMQRRGRGWQALANINDGHETYELVVMVVQTHGRWLVSNVSLPQ